MASMNTMLAVATLVVVFMSQGSEADIYERVICDTSVPGDIYGFSAVPITGSVLDTIQFESYRGQVVLITNVGPYNDRTAEKFPMLNGLQSTFAGQGFNVLGFPCNQFRREAPGTDTEIFNAITYVRPGNGYVPNFQLFSKTDVNGITEDEIFAFLKGGCSYTEDEFNTDLEYDTLRVGDVRQQYELFLVNKQGKVQFRYHATLADTQVLVDDITALLAA